MTDDLDRYAPEQASLDAEPTLGALPPRSAEIARVLVRFEADPAKPWTIRMLAKVAALSRAAFVRHFRSEIGASPYAYVTKRRMELAAALLLRSDDPLSEVAKAVGYTSEFAFNRAFKRHFGEAPGRYRRAATQHLPERTRCAA